MPRVLILSLFFPPDNVSTAQIMADLAEDLQALGHHITVITATPHYNRDPEAERRQPLTRKSLFFSHSEYCGISVVHTAIARKERSKLRRIVSWLKFSALSTSAAIRLRPKPDVILCPSPPLTIGVGAWIASKRHRAAYIYNVQEIYPDIAVNLGAVRNRMIIRLLRHLEKFVYEKAAAVTVIGPGMRRNLLAKGVPESKVHIIPNFVDVSEMVPLPKRNEFSLKHGIADEFVISYAGNMGPAQGLETFIEAANLLRGNREIRFLMLGNGILREQLEQQVAARKLDNFMFLPQQPYSVVPQIYAASDVSLVPQALDTGADAVPSKVFRIMACARPILAVTDDGSELAELIREAGCGVVIPPNSSQQMAEVIHHAAAELARWREMGQRGRGFVLSKFERRHVTRRYHDLVMTLAARK